VALRYLAHDGIGAAPDERDAEILQLGNRRFIPFNANDGGYVGADANGYQFLLDLRDLLATSPRYNLDQLLNGPIRPEDFHDQVVLIGVDAESLKDHFRVLRTPAGQFNAGVPGVALHGIIASQILRAAVEGEGPLHGVAESHEVLWLLLWCALGASISRQPRQPLGLTAVALAGTAADFAVGQALMIGDAWLPLAPSLAGWWLAIATNTALVARREYQQRRLLNRLFGLHVDTRIAAEIWANRTAICQGGRIPPQKLVATIFFSDLQGFTQIAETLEPDLFITWLNEYLDAMTTVIQRHDGVVIRFIGDAILAGFGVPVTRRSEEEIARDALNACRCALEIQRILMQMNQNWAARGLPSAAMRIGINTGPVLAGSLGNQDRLEYTVHGDVVNTAARLEQIEKDRFAPAPLERPCRMLIGGQTQTHVAAHINHRFLGPMVVKGKSLAVDVYELHGEEAAHPQAMGIADSQQGAVGVAPKNKPSP
jgi:adenylate cyclase